MPAPPPPSQARETAPPPASPRPTETAKPNGASELVGRVVETIDTRPPWEQTVALLAAPTAAAIGIELVVFFLLRRATKRAAWQQARPLIDAARWPARIIAAIVGLSIGAVALQTRGLLPAWAESGFPPTARTLSILAVAWLLVALIAGVDDMILARYDIEVRDNLKARKMHTQVRVISRTLMVLIVIGAAALSLAASGIVSEAVGASLLASTGIIGLAVGFAARPVLENIIAGIQIALTQPIRIGDAVIIENEWGWIEEITATYVVVKIWDWRRLIVPFSKIIGAPFQNWTRTTADILGSVVIHADYSLPVAELRRALTEIVAENDRWDGRVCVLQLIETTERAIVLRALVSAGDSPTCWDLRCEVREAMIAWIRRHHPGSLPRVRAELPEETAARRAAGAAAGAEA